MPPPARASGTLPTLVAAFVDFFSSDERPTFILQPRAPGHAQIVFVNSSLEVGFINSQRERFVTWTKTLLQPAAEHPAQDIIWANRIWQRKSIHPDYIVIYARGNIDVAIVQPATLEIPTVNGYDNDDHNKWVVDWTRFPCAAVNGWAKTMRQLPWERTDVGPMEHWPYGLRQILVAITACPDPRTVVWGPEGLLFHNEAARLLVGGELEQTLGFPIAKRAGPEIRAATQELLRRGLVSGVAMKSKRVRYTFNPAGVEQEVYYDFNQVPICGEDGYIYGSIFEFTDATTAVLQDYRKDLTSALLACMTKASDLHNLWSGIAAAFRASQSYLPYALIYTSTDEPSDTVTSVEIDKRPRLHLKEAVGIAEDAFPAVIDVTLESPSTQLYQRLFQTLDSGKTEIMSAQSGTLPREFIVERSDQPTITAACVLPLSGPDKKITGMVVLGINPRQPFLADDMDLMMFLRDSISNSASLIALPEDLRDKAELQASNYRLAQELRVLTAEKNESAFASLAHDAPCGMIILSVDGTPRFVNQAYLDLTGFVSLEQIRDISRDRSFWKDILTEEDWQQQEVHAEGSVIERLVNSGKPQKIQLEVLPPYDSAHPNAPRRSSRWIEALMLPEMNSAQEVSGIMGFVIDITDRKQAEELQRRSEALKQEQLAQQRSEALEQERHAQQLQDALAHKVAAESFIDTVSHELRNPLSAILQLADAVASTAQPLTLDTNTLDVAHSITEAARTIDICAQHMKTIVDDILTLSKLDSSLLSLSKEQSSPQELAHRALRMHEIECQSAQIKTDLVVEDSLRELSADPVIMDSSRVLQILLNLTSNAIKFTRDSATTRKLQLRLAAFERTPISRCKDFAFGPSDSVESDHEVTTSTTDVPARERLFIQYTVTDTGRGLTPEEITRLFQKFSQGSTKTYAQYGGSGLGLFISKKLCTLHGGRIGVKSDGLGHGCTFMFYVEVERAVVSPSLSAVTTATATATPPLPSLSPHKLSTGIHNNLITVKPQDAHEPKHTAANEGPTLNILIVEDNLVNQTVLAKQLRRVNHTVHIANHGLEALQFLESNHISRRDLTVPFPPPGNMSPFVILMDVEMPIMDGLTCTRKIRELETTGYIDGHTAIIAITANARDDQLSVALQSGVDDVVTKPFRLPMLIAKMRKVVEKGDGGRGSPA